MKWIKPVYPEGYEPPKSLFDYPRAGVDYRLPPLGILCERMQGFIHRASNSIKCSPGVHLGGLLIACSHEVMHTRIKLKSLAAWPNLYIAIIAPPGSGKTPAMKQMTGYINDAHSLEMSVFTEKHAQWERDLKKAEGKRDAASVAMLKANEPLQPTSHIQADGTMEAMLDSLAALEMAGKPPYILSDPDELASLICGMDQYTKSGKGGASNHKSYWLSLYGGTKVSRKLVSRHVFAKDARAGIIGTIQPKVARRILQDEGDGFLDRFCLFASYAPNPYAKASELLSEYEITDYVEMIKEGVAMPSKLEIVGDLVDRYDQWNLSLHQMGTMHNTTAHQKWKTLFFKLIPITTYLLGQDQVTLRAIDNAGAIATHSACEWLDVRQKNVHEDLSEVEDVLIGMITSARTPIKKTQLAQKMKTKLNAAEFDELLEDLEERGICKIYEQHSITATGRKGRSVAFVAPPDIRPMRIHQKHLEGLSI